MANAIIYTEILLSKVKLKKFNKSKGLDMINNKSMIDFVTPKQRINLPLRYILKKMKNKFFLPLVILKGEKINVK